VIHGAIHKARADVACIIHTHTPAGMAVAAMACGLLPMSQTSIRFHGHIGYHDYEGPAVDLAERERLVADLGAHDAMVMRNHGLLTCGATIQQAFNTMYQLEMSCRAQVDAMAAQTDLTMPGENVLAHTAHLYQPGTRRPADRPRSARSERGSKPTPGGGRSRSQDRATPAGRRGASGHGDPHGCRRAMRTA